MAQIAGTPWYLADEALDVIALIAKLPVKIEWRTQSYVLTRDEWEAFVGPLPSSLEAWHDALFDRGYSPRPLVEDVIAAVTGERLSGLHYADDEARLIGIRDDINAALAARCTQPLAA